MIHTINSQSNHLITYLNNYTVDCNDSEYLKFEFAYAELDSFILNGITEFKEKWKKGIRREKQFFEFSHPITLIASEYIFDEKHADEKGFEYFKFDSVSFLKEKPDFSNIIAYSLKGGITCYFDFFTIDTERIPDGRYYSSIIYRSPRYTYSRIEKIINNYRQQQV
jgi:hypothetical protein